MMQGQGGETPRFPIRAEYLPAQKPQQRNRDMREIHDVDFTDEFADGWVRQGLRGERHVTVYHEVETRTQRAQKSNLKTLFNALTCSILSLVAVHVVFAYAMWNPDVSQWHRGYRVLAVIVSFCVAVFAFVLSDRRR